MTMKRIRECVEDGIELPLKDIFEKFKTTCLLMKNLKNKSFP